MSDDSEIRKHWRRVADEGMAGAITQACIAGAFSMREAAAKLAETSKGYPTELSEAIRALPLPCAKT